MLRGGQGRGRTGPLRGEEAGRLVRHVTLCLLAHAFLVVTRRAAAEEKALLKGDLDLELIPPTVPEVRRLVLAMAEPKSRRRFLLGWSVWRRAHQAVASRYRAAKRAAGRTLSGEGSPKTLAIAPEEAGLTDEQWALVSPLLPPQRGEIGRPPNDHRAVLGGI